MATVPPEFPRDRGHRREARKASQACQNPEALLDFMIFRIPILLGPHHHWLEWTWTCLEDSRSHSYAKLAWLLPHSGGVGCFAQARTFSTTKSAEQEDRSTCKAFSSSLAMMLDSTKVVSRFKMSNVRATFNFYPPPICVRAFFKGGGIYFVFFFFFFVFFFFWSHGPLIPWCPGHFVPSSPPLIV